jgi:hypothetical protein
MAHSRCCALRSPARKCVGGVPLPCAPRYRQPATPFQGLRRATSRAEIATIWSGRHCAIVAAPSVPRQASASSMRTVGRA